MSNLSAGYGECVITPPLGLDLCGYGFYLDRKAEAVLDDLKVRALFLRNEKRALLLLVCDLVGLTVEFSDRVRAGLSAAHRLPASHVLLACTHTHSGPATQPLPGLGRVNAAYMKDLEARIAEAAAGAVSSAAAAEFRHGAEAVEPIGYNRRRNDFRDIDPCLRVAVFETKLTRIHLLNYACHAVVLGPRKDISADWPGSVVREVEGGGDRALFLQGFCGDVDPVTQLNRWGRGAVEDLQFYGDLLGRRLEKLEGFAAREDRTELAALEKRIRLPLDVYGKREIEREAAAFRVRFARFPGAERFAEEWKENALERYAALGKAPFLDNVPIQALAVGPLRLLALPGEVFCGIGIKLARKLAPFVPVGYANGCVGYIPTRTAFRDRSDYACYCAPMIYQGFPFTPEVEGILLLESHKIGMSLFPGAVGRPGGKNRSR